MRIPSLVQVLLALALSALCVLSSAPVAQASGPPLSAVVNAFLHAYRQSSGGSPTNFMAEDVIVKGPFDRWPETHGREAFRASNAEIMPYFSADSVDCKVKDVNERHKQAQVTCNFRGMVYEPVGVARDLTMETLIEFDQQNAITRMTSWVDGPAAEEVVPPARPSPRWRW